MGWLEDLQKKQQGETDSAPKTHYCWHCAKEIAANNFHRQDTCENCGRSTHACKNCEYYDPTFNNLCRESSADEQDPL